MRHVVRFGAWLPFEHAAKEMALNHKVTLSKEQVRRKTEQAGRVYEQRTDSSAECSSLLYSSPGATDDVCGWCYGAHDQRGLARSEDVGPLPRCNPIGAP